jgi:hypothetical protein
VKLNILTNFMMCKFIFFLKYLYTSKNGAKLSLSENLSRSKQVETGQDRPCISGQVIYISRQDNTRKVRSRHLEAGKIKQEQIMIRQVSTSLKLEKVRTT